ncbi:hypothetical protein ACFSKU_12115 [Pontibacter silvestris]|uniref:Uncharacterized protein n=1 Tax=Pontibacter silvestris TaxID=2305183 RepID=A0ABW4WZ24_9BACT|nr:hypothetical protein [Pontibacter silvestris]MCC9135236.1 hypothetical protein [Pontibacter silvestris]
MKYLASFFIFSLLVFSAFGQKRELMEIQYITIKDTFLVKEMEKLIQDEVNREPDTTTTDKVFTENFFAKGLGYVRLYAGGNLEGDTLTRYYIAPSLVSIKKEAADYVYPPFYSYVGGRLVLVYVPVLENVTKFNFSKKSKKKLRKRVDAFLEKPRDMTFYDMEGNVAFKDKHFRIDYFRIHDDKYIYILKNKPPIVIRDPL